MKIDDVSLTIFAWDGIPATNYHTGTATAGNSNLGLLRIHTDEGLEGHAFLGSATNPASMDGPQLIRSLKPMLMGQNPLERERLHGAMRLISRIVSATARSARWIRRCGTCAARSRSCRCMR